MCYNNSVFTQKLKVESVEASAETNCGVWCLHITLTAIAQRITFEGRVRYVSSVRIVRQPKEHHANHVADTLWPEGTKSNEVQRYCIEWIDKNRSWSSWDHDDYKTHPSYAEPEDGEPWPWLEEASPF